MSTSSASATWAQLAEPERTVPPRFDPSCLSDVPAPAQRWLRRAIPAGAPLVSTVELAMIGEIKLAGRWMPFRAEQILRAGMGFVWHPVVGGPILRFTGADVSGPDGASMDFRLHGIVPVARASGPDVERSAAGRLAAETVAWLPQAATPQHGACWTAVDDERAIVTVDAAGHDIDVMVAVDADGRLTSLGLQRWKDSVHPPALVPFGGVVREEFVTPDGVRIAGAGSVGWDWGTSRQTHGEFFRYEITEASRRAPAAPETDRLAGMRRLFGARPSVLPTTRAINAQRTLSADRCTSIR